MTYTIVSNPDVEATFRKIGKKDITRFEQLVKKLQVLVLHIYEGNRKFGRIED